MNDTKPQLMTTRELAAYLRLKPATVRGHTRSGKIPHVRVGGSIRYELAAVLAAQGRTDVKQA